MKSASRASIRLYVFYSLEEWIVKKKLWQVTEMCKLHKEARDSILIWSLEFLFIAKNWKKKTLFTKKIDHLL